MSQQPSDPVSPLPPTDAEVIDALVDLVVMADRNGVIVWISPSVTRTLGWTADELIGRPLFDLLADGPERDLQFASVAETFAVPGAHPAGLVTVLARDGTPVHVESLMNNRLDEPGSRTLAIVGRVVDDRPASDDSPRHRDLWATTVLRGARELVIGCREDGVISYASPSTRGVLGVSADALYGTDLGDLVHPDDRPRMDDALAEDGAGPMVLRFRHGDGAWRHLRVEVAPLVADPDSSGVAGAFVITGADVTERRQVQDLLADQASVLERIARGAPIDDALDAVARLVSHRLDRVGVVVCYGDGRGDWNDRALDVPQKVLDVLDRTAVIRPHVTEGGIDGSRRPKILRAPGWSAVVRAATGGAAQGCWAIDLITGVGRVAGRLVVLVADDRAPTAAEAELVDRAADLVTIAVERHILHERMERQALHDDLTGMANRHLLMQAIREASLDYPEGGLGLLFCDLDRFKLINDSLGHEAGDRLLIEVAARFRRGVRPGDLVARIGGDEFVVLCPGLEDEEVVLRIADRLAASLTEPIDLPGSRVVVSASIGVAIAHGRVHDPSMLLRDADLAMYDAKQSGRGRHAVFRAEMRSQAVERLELENALRVALRADEMRLAYQPIVALADGALRGYEALLRWHRPGVGLVGPNDFIPVATETGLIVPLGRWVINEAVAEAVRWPDVPVSVNLAARQLGDPGLVEYVSEVLEDHGLEPSRLILEMTESDLMADPEKSADVLRRLKEIGVRLAIDDFGTGFATLDYVRRFAVADILKIDASFVAGLADDQSRDRAIVSAALVLARNLGFEAVAEGVELAEQRDALIDLGCTLGQGHLFGHPVPAEALPHRQDEAEVAVPAPAE